MNKDFKMCPVTKFVAWFILGLIVCIIGISNVFALENNNRIFFYDNFGTSATSVSTTYVEQIDESYADFTTQANSYGGLVVIQLNTPLIQNHIYSLFVNVGAESNGGSTQLSSKNCIGIGNGYANTIDSYINCSVSPRYSVGSGQTTDKGRGLYFTFIANTNGTYIAIPYTSRYTCYNCRQYSYGYEINDAGDSSNLTQSQVNNIISQQTNSINNSIQTTEDNLRGAIQQTEENITNSIDNNFNSCKDVLIDNTFTFNKENNWVRYTGSNYVAFGPNTNLTGRQFIGYYSFDNDLKNNDMSLSISDFSNRNITYSIYIYGDGLSGSNIITSGSSMPISFNTGNYKKINIGIFAEGTNYTSNDYFTLYDFTLNNYCTNKLDETNNNLNNINDSINNDNVDSSSWANFFNNFTTNTFGLTSIITAPLNLIQSLTNTTCTDLQIPLPYLNNKYLTLPCMTSIYSQYFGSFFTLYQSITYGIIAYWVCVRIFNLVKDFKNPEHDEIEVVDL